MFNLRFHVSTALKIAFAYQRPEFFPAMPQGFILTLCVLFDFLVKHLVIIMYASRAVMMIVAQRHYKTVFVADFPQRSSEKYVMHCFPWSAADYAKFHVIRYNRLFHCASARFLRLFMLCAHCAAVMSCSLLSL